MLALGKVQPWSIRWHAATASSKLLNIAIPLEMIMGCSENKYNKHRRYKKEGGESLIERLVIINLQIFF